MTIIDYATILLTMLVSKIICKFAMRILTAREISVTDLESQFNLQYIDHLTFF
jgi:hypothetical protein